MPLIKRTVKGSPLTFAEGDANLDYLEALALSTGSLATTGSNVFRANQTIIGGNLSVNSATVTAGAFSATQNHYTELSLQNTSIGPSASADFVVYGDNGTLFDHYIDMGINNSGLSPNYQYGGTFLGRADDAYLYHVGGNFKIGNATSSSISQSLYLFANPSGNIDLSITGSRVGIRKSGSLNATLDVNGSAIITGSLTVTTITSFPLVSSSYEFANDASASLGGIPLGGLYHTSGVIRIRLT
jgi:hypothetical protein